MMDLTLRELGIYLALREKYASRFDALWCKDGWERIVNTTTGKLRYQTIRGARLGLCALIYRMCLDKELTLSLYRKSPLHDREASEQQDLSLVRQAVSTFKPDSELKRPVKPIKTLFPYYNNISGDKYIDIYNPGYIRRYNKIINTPNITTGYACFLIVLLDIVFFLTPDKHNHYTVFEENIATRLEISTRQVKKYVARATQLGHIVKYPARYISGNNKLLIGIPSLLAFGDIPPLPVKPVGRPRKTG